MIAKFPVRRVSALAIGAAAAIPLALSVPASPASAATNCGAQQTARTSILYKACADKWGGRIYAGRYLYGNNHGSAVSITTQYGWKVGNSTTWDDAVKITLRAAPGFVDRKSMELSCDAGQKITAVVRVKQNNGDWGKTATSNTLTCAN